MRDSLSECFEISNIITFEEKVFFVCDQHPLTKDAHLNAHYLSRSNDPNVKVFPIESFNLYFPCETHLLGGREYIRPMTI